MQQIEKIIRTVTNAPFGFCAFSDVEPHLLECRAKARLPENAKTVIIFAFPYKVKDEAPKNISRYAAVPDYHNVCGKILEKLAEILKNEYKGYRFEPFIDNSPIPEVQTAARAGLGVRGKNGVLITRQYGSFVFIGEIVTDMKLEPTAAEVCECDDCGVCKAACPVALCKCECLSAVTQQKKPLSDGQTRLITENGTVWGCDICQNACPHNKNAEITDIDEFIRGYRDGYTVGEDISGRAYEWRGEKTVRRNAKLFN